MLTAIFGVSTDGRITRSYCMVCSGPHPYNKKKGAKIFSKPL